ncbi:MAG TPA: metallophosphoesterase [Candidatus Sulfotelmatobacter sp.]|nr:metallophosphoesterase [Candidatus Sulfotelmatobacter sp.]
MGSKPTPPEKETVRLAAVADLHCTKDGLAALQPLFAAAARAADILILCGDLTDNGVPEEAHALVKALGARAEVPVVALLGNHDYQSGKEEEIRQILTDTGICVLQGTACEIYGVGFAGAKGFGGGFGDRALQPWGEESLKRFVREAVDESLKLESALAKLRTSVRFALLHYAPIRTTVEGEPLEIYAFLGSSRLEEPLTHYAVAGVFHGHAHRGTLEGRTRGDVPVYNVSLPLLRRSFPNDPPFRLVTVKVPGEVDRA